jgi:hypothetical protein
MENILVISAVIVSIALPIILAIFLRPAHFLANPAFISQIRKAHDAVEFSEVIDRLERVDPTKRLCGPYLRATALLIERIDEEFSIKINQLSSLEELEKFKTLNNDLFSIQVRLLKKACRNDKESWEKLTKQRVSKVYEERLDQCLLEACRKTTDGLSAHRLTKRIKDDDLRVVALGLTDIKLFSKLENSFDLSEICEGYALIGDKGLRHKLHRRLTEIFFGIYKSGEPETLKGLADSLSNDFAEYKRKALLKREGLLIKRFMSETGDVDITAFKAYYESLKFAVSKLHIINAYQERFPEQAVKFFSKEFGGINGICADKFIVEILHHA